MSYTYPTQHGEAGLGLEWNQTKAFAELYVPALKTHPLFGLMSKKEVGAFTSAQFRRIVPNAQMSYFTPRAFSCGDTKTPTSPPTGVVTLTPKTYYVSKEVCESWYIKGQAALVMDELKVAANELQDIIVQDFYYGGVHIAANAGLFDVITDCVGVSGVYPCDNPCLSGTAISVTTIGVGNTHLHQRGHTNLQATMDYASYDSLLISKDAAGAYLIPPTGPMPEGLSILGTKIYPDLNMVANSALIGDFSKVYYALEFFRIKEDEEIRTNTYIWVVEVEAGMVLIDETAFVKITTCT